VLKTSSWRVSILIQTERLIDRRCPHLDRRIIRCYCLCCSSSATRSTLLENGSSVHSTVPRVSPSVLTRPTIAPTLVVLVLSVHPTVCFLFLSLLGFDPRKIDYLLNLACDIFAFLGPRSVYKDMLNSVVSPIDHVVMNHQKQTRTNGIWGHVRYNIPFLVIYDNRSKASIYLRKLTKLVPLTLAWMLTIIQTPPRSTFPLFDHLFLCSHIACLFPLWNHLLALVSHSPPLE
jgi:hypothetical protein